VDGWRSTTLTELVEAWPELTGGTAWGLAVDPATPIGLLVAPDEVATLVPTRAALASFVPANEVERLLRDAMTSPDPEVMLDVLVSARVVVPRKGLVVAQTPTVAVFTSPQRCNEYLAAVGVNAETLVLDFVEVLRQWPGPQFQLSVNLGSLIGFSLPPDAVPGLLAHAHDVARRHAPPPAPRPPAPRPPVTPGGSVADLLRGG
jgi:hypothetical protein